MYAACPALYRMVMVELTERLTKDIKKVTEQFMCMSEERIFQIQGA